MNLLGARLQPETEFAEPPRQPDLGSNMRCEAKAEWTMDVPAVATHDAEFSSDDEK